MNKATRAQLLRIRLERKGKLVAKSIAKPRGMAHPNAPIKPSLKDKATAPQSLTQNDCCGYRNGDPFGPLTKRHQVQWVREPDAKPEKELGKKNRKEVSPLTKIAANPGNYCSTVTFSLCSERIRFIATSKSR